MGRRGPKPNFYRHTDGQIIDGLIRRSDGRFQAHGSTKTFGRDSAQAVFRFRQWRAAREREKIAFDIPKTVQEAADEGGLAALIAATEYARHPGESTERTASRTVPVPSFLPAEVVWDRLGQLIRDNPKLAAQKLGIEEIGWLRTLRPPPPSVRLSELGECYVKKQPPLSAETIKKAKAHWNEFCGVVEVELLKDIEAAHIREYHAVVYEALERGRSRTYVNHRFGHIKTILSHAKTLGIDQEQCQRVLTLCAMLKPPPSDPVDPKPISRADFHKLLGVCDAKWTAVLLLSLNACLYAAEVAAVRNDEVDLEKGTFVSSRRKTRVARVAVLWPRTAAAIERYRRANPHLSESLFVSQNGMAYSANHIRRNFARRRRAAGIEVEFNQLRDGAYTNAVASGVDVMQAQILAGHAAGVKDHYVRRNPRMVEAACRAVEEYYFGAQDIGTR